MNKDIVFNLIKGLGITSIVAGVMSYFISFIGIPFLPTFLVLVLAQFIFFYFYGEYQRKNFLKMQMDAQIKYAEIQSSQSTTVTCPCDRNLQTTIPININGENSYTCQGCEKLIKVSIETKTALATTPVVSSPLDSPLFLDHVEKLLKKDGN